MSQFNKSFQEDILVHLRRLKTITLTTMLICYPMTALGIFSEDPSHLSDIFVPSWCAHKHTNTHTDRQTFRQENLQGNLPLCLIKKGSPLFPHTRTHIQNLQAEDISTHTHFAVKHTNWTYKHTVDGHKWTYPHPHTHTHTYTHTQVMPLHGNLMEAAESGAHSA